MAATAYASLVSLLNTVDQIHIHPLVSTFFDINQTKYLCENVNFLVDFVEKYSSVDSNEMEDLVSRIANAAHEAENAIEVYAADRVRGGESPSFLRHMQMIIEGMESIKKEVIKIKEQIAKNPSFSADLPLSSSVAAPPATSEAITVVGFDDYMDQLFNDLTGHDDDRQIISITGMGGVGKTTLAKKLYENSHVVHHFNVRVWVTVSQECSPRKVFLQALSSLGGGAIDMDTTNDQKLSLQLHKTLFNRRYLIILDDVWSVDIWDKIKFYFPENNNGSRIVVTTRESKLVDLIGSSALAVKLLDKEKSWKLFCEKTFPEQNFPSNLEEVGKKIVTKCGGLPLTITVIGGLLGKSPRTKEYWEEIAEDKSLILNLRENNPLSILYLSYKYLPVCLKSCFLHFGSYSEDSLIDVFQFIKLWVAEGNVKSKGGQSLEEVAESYINDLAERNLLKLVISRPSWKVCYIHDLVRDLCKMIGEKEKFFSVQRSIDGSHHFIVEKINAGFYWMPPIRQRIMLPGERAAPFKTRLLRVLHCDDRSPYRALQDDKRAVSFKTILLRVLCCVNRCPNLDALEEVNVRLLYDNSSKRHHYLVPSLLSQFWCLHTLIVRKGKKIVAPAEIWMMPQLRHIDVQNLYLPGLPPPASDDDVCVLENLLTLKEVRNLIFTEEVCKRIPNITKLYLHYHFNPRSPYCYHLENLCRFNKLELLHYLCCLSKHFPGDSFRNIKFPSSLKQLTLKGCKLEWSYMAVIASLPHLQLLTLEWNAIAETEWVFVDEKYVSLKELTILGCKHVKKWVAESSNFPVLESLYIQQCPKLNVIPSSFGEIPTLQSIILDSCSESANISAVEILHEQENFGNLDLRLSIKTNEAALFRKKIEELGLTCQNLSIERNKT